MYSVSTAHSWDCAIFYRTWRRRIIPRRRMLPFSVTISLPVRGSIRRYYPRPPIRRVGQQGQRSRTVGIPVAELDTLNSLLISFPCPEVKYFSLSKLCFPRLKTIKQRNHGRPSNRQQT